MPIARTNGHLTWKNGHLLWNCCCQGCSPVVDGSGNPDVPGTITLNLDGLAGCEEENPCSDYNGTYEAGLSDSEGVGAGEGLDADSCYALWEYADDYTGFEVRAYYTKSTRTRKLIISASGRGYCMSYDWQVGYDSGDETDQDPYTRAEIEAVTLEFTTGGLWTCDTSEATASVSCGA